MISFICHHVNHEQWRLVMYNIDNAPIGDGILVMLSI